MGGGFAAIHGLLVQASICTIMPVISTHIVMYFHSMAAVHSWVRRLRGSHMGLSLGRFSWLVLVRLIHPQLMSSMRKWVVLGGEVYNAPGIRRAHHFNPWVMYFWVLSGVIWVRCII